MSAAEKSEKALRAEKANVNPFSPRSFLLLAYRARNGFTV